MFVLYVTKCWIVLSSFTQSVQGNLNSPPSRSLQIFPPIDEVLGAQKIYLWLLSLLYLGGMGVIMTPPQAKSAPALQGFHFDQPKLFDNSYLPLYQVATFAFRPKIT